MSQQMEAPAVLVEGVLHQGSKMVISGGSKSYKTWTLLDLALSIAAGRDWLGKPTTRCKVLFVNFELQDYFFRRRIEEIMVAKGITADEVRDTFFYVGLRGVKVTNTNTLVERLQVHTTGQDFRAFILDPLYKMHGDRDENSAGDMADLMNYIDRLGRATDAAVIFGHHFSKGNQASKDMRDRGAGSGAIMRDADTIMTLTPHEEEDAYVVECVPRNFPPWQSFVVRREHPLMVPDDSLNARRLRQANHRPELYSDEDLTALLDQQPLTTSEWQQAASERLQMGRSTFYNRRRDLMQANAVTFDGERYSRVPTSPPPTGIRRLIPLSPA